MTETDNARYDEERMKRKSFDGERKKRLINRERRGRIERLVKQRLE